MSPATRVLAASLLLSTTAFASGIEMGENGATTVLQGGAFTGQANDLSAIEHNPAGLTQLDGFNFEVDLQLLNHDVSFTRQDVGFDPNALSPLYNTTKNSSGLFPLPYAGVGYSLRVANRKLSFALGAFGPPAVGRYQYAVPNYEKNSSGTYLENPKKYAPNRYALINSDILIIFPSASVAFEVHKMLSIGVSAELVLSDFKFRQALYSGLSTAASPRDEDPVFDSLADVRLTGGPGFTATIGALFKPLDWLQVGASARLPTPVKASGTLDITLGEAATALNTTLGGVEPCPYDASRSCGKADLAINLPLQVRAGVYVRPPPLPKLGVNVDFVYEGWHAFDQILLTPRDVTMTIGSGTPQAVAPVPIPKNWRDSFSGRLGLSYDVIDLLTLHAGTFYETSSSPDEYFSIDFAHPDRIFFTGGATVHVKMFDVSVGGLYTPTVTKNITQSSQLLTNTDPSIAGSVIGTGQYVTTGWGLVFGVKGKFGGEAKPAAAPEPELAPASTPRPVPETTPAPEAPAPTETPATPQTPAPVESPDA